MKNLKKNKKGFTLVEVIVVLVILAILAAIMVPSMIGWISKAEEKTALVEARTVLVSAQTIASENYNTYASGATTAMTEAHRAEVVTLTGLTGISVSSVTLNKGQVTAFSMTSSGGYTVTYGTAKGAAKPDFTITKS